METSYPPRIAIRNITTGLYRNPAGGYGSVIDARVWTPEQWVFQDKLPPDEEPVYIMETVRVVQGSPAATDASASTCSVSASVQPTLYIMRPLPIVQAPPMTVYLVVDWFCDDETIQGCFSSYEKAFASAQTHMRADYVAAEPDADTGLVLGWRRLTDGHAYEGVYIRSFVLDTEVFA